MKIYLFYLVIINVISFILYGIDKLNAKLNIFRIPEKVLLNLSIFGGVYGSILGMCLFHHKTRKKLFIRVNVSCFIIYTLFIIYLWRHV